MTPSTTVAPTNDGGCRHDDDHDDNHDDDHDDDRAADRDHSGDDDRADDRRPTTEPTTGGVEACDDTSTDPLEPAPPPAPLPTVPPTTSPTTSPTPSPEGPAPAPETSATAATPATATEAPSIATDDISTPHDPTVSATGATPAPAMTPPVIAPPVIEPQLTPPVIPALNSTWTTGVTRSGTPREPGPSAPRSGRTPAGHRVILADQVEVILATIRQLESGGRYDIGPNAAKASGAYQYIPSTWRNEGGYPHAYLAPPEIQDARARSDVERFMAMYGGDVSMVPVMWYYPRAASDPKWMDRVPNPAGGNRLTIREYQARWMALLAQNAEDLLGTYVPVPDSPAAASVLTAFPEPPGDAGFEEYRIGLNFAAARPPGAESDQDADAAPFILDAVTVSDRTVEFAARSVPPEATEELGAGWMRPIVFPVLGPVAYANGWGDPATAASDATKGPTSSVWRCSPCSLRPTDGSPSCASSRAGAQVWRSRSVTPTAGATTTSTPTTTHRRATTARPMTASAWLRVSSWATRWSRARSSATWVTRETRRTRCLTCTSSSAIRGAGPHPPSGR